MSGGWNQLKEAGGIEDPWVAEHIEELVDLEHAALDALDGDRLVHTDIRSDNLLFTDHGEVVFVDWAHACTGPGWLDLVLWLPALELEGGGTPEEVLAHSAAPSAPEDAVTAVVAATAGYFLHRSTLPDPPGLPTLRSFQRDQARTALSWLRRRLGSPFWWRN